VVDAVRLLQSELLALSDAVWVVRCAPETQMERLMTIRKMTSAAAEGRLAAQPSFSHPRVTTVIENSGSPQELRDRVDGAWKSLLEEWGLTRTQT
jgi:dephospho-CoA kinase